MSTIDGNSQISFPSTISGSLHPGNRVKIDASSDPNRIYFVNNISSDGLTVTLTENFDGASLSQLATVALVIGGIPQISVEVTRHGVDEYFYDVFFIGEYIVNYKTINVNVGRYSLHSINHFGASTHFSCFKNREILGGFISSTG